MQIFGAGLSGLIAAHMLKFPIVYEAQSEVPNNHAAVLRFRSDAVSLATGIPFKKVTVRKAISYEKKLYSESSIKLDNLYSNKVANCLINRSISNLEDSTRYIAPSNFIWQLAASCNFKFGHHIGLTHIQDPIVPKISTIPMPLMMEMTGWNFKYGDSKFESQEIQIIEFTADGLNIGRVDLYQTIYYPSKFDLFYRISITGDKIIGEYIKGKCNPPIANVINMLETKLGQDFGISMDRFKVYHKTQKYGKILPIDENLRHDFIDWLTEKYNIYSLGRFATWRQILLDDVVNDVNVIQRLINSGHHYRRTLNKLK